MMTRGKNEMGISDSSLGQIKYKSSKEVNKAGREYYLARSTAQLEVDRKELEKQQQAAIAQELANMQAQREILNMMAELDYKQKIIENTAKAASSVIGPAIGAASQSQQQGGMPPMGPPSPQMGGGGGGLMPLSSMMPPD